MDEPSEIRAADARRSSAISCLVATFIVSSAAAGCLGAGNSSSTAPSACESAPPPRYAHDAPYAASELRARTHLNGSRSLTEPQLTSIFAALSPEIRSFNGDTYADVSAKLFPRDSPPGDVWVFQLDGRPSNSSGLDRYDFWVTSDGEVDARSVGGKGVDAEVQEALFQRAAQHASRDAILDVAPHPDGATWSPEWPSCVRLEFTSNPPGEPAVSPHGAAHVYVDLHEEVVIPEGVLLFPSGTEGPPDPWAG